MADLPPHMQTGQHAAPMFKECQRFSKPQVFEAEGGRGPSSKRLTYAASTGALPSVMRRPGAMAKHSTMDEGLLTRKGSKAPHIMDVKEPDAQTLRDSHGELCYVCGSKTAESGKGLRACPECGSIQLKSGGMSHSFAIAHDAGSGSGSRAGSKRPAEGSPSKSDRSPSKPGSSSGSRAGSKQNKGGLAAAGAMTMGDPDAAVDSGMGGINGLAARNAWRRLSQTGPQEMAYSTGGMQVDNVSDPHEKKVPVMAGLVETGYFVGDRVQTNLRLAMKGGAWDPLNGPNNQGTVQGPGRVSGEIMVKFDANDNICSMKLGHLQHVKIKEASTNVERNRQRHIHLMRHPTVG